MPGTVTDELGWRRDVPLATMSAKPSANLTAAGVLLIVAGMLALLQGFALFGMESYFIDEGFTDTRVLACCGALEILLGIGAAAGGYFAIRASNYGLVIVGCLCAMAGFGMVFGTVIGIIALVLVASRRNEFRR